MEIKIKVCGMKHLDNIQDLANLQPDYMGLIFYQKSPRYVGQLSSEQLKQSLSPHTIPVGVFVNEDLIVLEDICNAYNLNHVQLHGSESPAYCQALKEKGFTLLKAFSVGDSFDFDQLTPYQDVVDYFLFDTKGKSHGGNGETFNWDLLNTYSMNIPFFLSGGLSPENISSVTNLSHLPIYAVDVNSKFELEPGLKDISLLKNTVFKALRKS